MHRNCLKRCFAGLFDCEIHFESASIFFYWLFVKLALIKRPFDDKCHPGYGLFPLAKCLKIS